MLSTTPPGSPPSSVAITGAVPDVSVGNILRDAAAEDKYDDGVKTAEAALKAMKLGSPDAPDG